jgi:hypothetical protein
MTLIKGLYAKDKHEKAPDFVKCDISIKRLDMLEFLTNRKEEWINCQLLRSKEGKLYIAENEFKPEKKEQKSGDLPF